MRAWGRGITRATHAPSVASDNAITLRLVVALLLVVALDNVVTLLQVIALWRVIALVV